MKIINKKTLSILLVIVMICGLLAGCTDAAGDTNSPADTDNSQHITTEPTAEPTAEPADTKPDLGNGLKITDVGAYTGIYMEDGTDEVISGVFMMILTNNGDKTLQYAAITIPTATGDAKFEVTTLPAGKSVILLEKNRMAYDKAIDYTAAKADSIAFFAEEQSKMEDTVKVQILDGVINVKNISENDIEGEIIIYYKNSAADMYYGGITYRSHVTGGLAKGETRQIAGAHASKTGSALMFVQII